MLFPPEELTPLHRVSDFSCGKSALDDWLKTRALSNQQKGFSRVLVVHANLRVVAYYSLAPTGASPSTLPRAIRTGQPPDPVPCILLGQFAVDLHWAGRGIGSALLNHAFDRCLLLAKVGGGRALVVNAVDKDAAIFWRRRGFVPSKDDSLTLYRAIDDIAATRCRAG